MPTEKCLCGATVEIDQQYLWSFGERQIVIGCKACQYTGAKSRRESVKAIVINTSNDNGGGNHGAE